jgi:hypothetical protein
VLRQKPDDIMSLSNGGMTCGILFELALDQGQGDPAQVERGLALLEEASRRQPDNVPAMSNQVFLLRLRARWAREHGQDPQPFLARGREAARRAQAPAGGDASAFYEAGFLELEAARCDRGRDPGPALAQAEREFRAAARINPQETDAYRGLAEGVLMRADGARLPAPVLEAAIRDADRGLVLNPANRALALDRAGLQIHLARGLEGEARRRVAGLAAAGLEAALKDVGDSGGTWKDRLEEARRLAR